MPYDEGAIFENLPAPPGQRKRSLEEIRETKSWLIFENGQAGPSLQLAPSWTPLQLPNDLADDALKIDRQNGPP